MIPLPNKGLPGYLRRKTLEEVGVEEGRGDGRDTVSDVRLEDQKSVTVGRVRGHGQIVDKGSE